MSQSSIGIIGLGVMGKSLAKNILSKGHSLSVYNRAAPGEEHIVQKFLDSEDRPVLGFTELVPFVESLAPPKKILIMIKAGDAVDNVIDALKPLLSANDVIIDGGNSHHKETNRRIEDLKENGIHFIGCGISGGEEGALKGPSMMPGGAAKGYSHIKDILTSISAKDDQGSPCCTYVGDGGAGHFVKTIHNGIEYAEMQLLAETYHILRGSNSNEEIAQLFSGWNKGDLSSFLLEITIDILRRKEGNKYLLDLVLDKAANKGTGSWSSQSALELGFPATMITDAVYARYVSSFRQLRQELHHKREIDSTISTTALEEAYRFGRWINHIQGFMVIDEASKQYNWHVNLSELARIWTNGCIIRSNLMQELVALNKEGMLLKNNKVFGSLIALEEATKKVLTSGVNAGIPLPVLSSSYQFWLGITTGHLSANLIQAQRDCFGAHTYSRLDRPESEAFHSKWQP